jgi:hypothetical protein
MAHTSQHLGGKRIVTDVLAKLESLPQVLTPSAGVTDVIRHPSSELVEFRDRSEQLPPHTVLESTSTQQRHGFAHEVVADSRAGMPTTKAVVELPERSGHRPQGLDISRANDPLDDLR